MCDKALVMCRTYDDLIAEAVSLLRFYAAKTIGEPYLELNRLANDLEYKVADIAADEWGKQDDLLIAWNYFKRNLLDGLETSPIQDREMIAPLQRCIGYMITDPDLRKKLED